ncbi:MAG: molybdate ABC transporter substrate-binding protein [Thermoguttaceae bacterium]
MRKRNWSVGCAILILAAWVPASRGEDPATPAGAAVKAKESVLVFAAASTTNALNEINAQFTKDSGVVVQTSYAGSSTLAQQILHGAEADLFLSADTKWADYLAKKDQVVRQQDLLGNRLVIVVPADSKTEVKKPEDLLDPGIEHLALAEPQSVPAGIYAKQALTKLGLWDQLKPKVVSAADVRRALGYVETGSAEAGIVYATDAAVSKNVRVVAEIPEKLTGPVRYPVVLLKHGENSDAAQLYWRHLSSPVAAKVFQKYGFTVVSTIQAAPEGPK